LAPNWIHVLFDIITHGKYIDNYSEYHRWKDQPSEWLGKEHRIERHDDCNRVIKKLKDKGIKLNVGNSYDLLKSFSLLKNFNLEELEAIGVVHEVLDNVWSRLSEDQKRGWEETFRDMVLNPTDYFRNGLLDPEDLELEAFKEVKHYLNARVS